MKSETTLDKKNGDERDVVAAGPAATAAAARPQKNYAVTRVGREMWLSPAPASASAGRGDGARARSTARSSTDDGADVGGAGGQQNLQFGLGDQYDSGNRK